MSADNDNESGRWPPKRCEMPDLPDLHGKFTLGYFLNREFRNTGLQIDGPGQMQFLNFIRLLDKTLIEYRQAREHLQQYVGSDSKLSQFFRCTDHMENCVDSLHRTFLHLEGLKASLHKEQERPNKPLPQINRDDLPKGKDRNRIRSIRRAIQHMDRDISRGKVGEGVAPIGLNVKSDSIELDHKIIYFTELAEWIRQTCVVAEQLIDYAPPTE